MKSFALISTAILLLGAPALAAQQDPLDEFLLDPFNPTAYLAYHAALAKSHHPAKPPAKPKVTHLKTVPAVTPPVENAAAVTITLPASATPAVTPAPSTPASSRVVAPPSTGAPYDTVTAIPAHPLVVPPVIVPPIVVAPPAPSNVGPSALSLPAGPVVLDLAPSDPIHPAGRPIVIVPFRPPVISAFRP